MPQPSEAQKLAEQLANGELAPAGATGLQIRFSDKSVLSMTWIIQLQDVNETRH